MNNYSVDFWYRWGDNEKDYAEDVPTFEATDFEHAKCKFIFWLECDAPRKYRIGIIRSSIEINLIDNHSK